MDGKPAHRQQPSAPWLSNFMSRYATPVFVVVQRTSAEPTFSSHSRIGGGLDTVNLSVGTFKPDGRV